MAALAFLPSILKCLAISLPDLNSLILLIASSKYSNHSGAILGITLKYLFIVGLYLIKAYCS